MKHMLALGAILAAMTCAGQSVDDYGDSQFGGSSYAMNGPPPAYGGAYAQYGGRNMPAMTGRFNAIYGEYGARPGYARDGGASGYGTGVSRGAGTGFGMWGHSPPLFDLFKSQSAARPPRRYLIPPPGKGSIQKVRPRSERGPDERSKSD